MESNEPIAVLSDKNGNIYLEGVGHFPNQTPNKEFSVKKEGEILVLFDIEKRIDQELVPIMFVPKTSIELPLFELPYVRNGMTYPDEVKESIEFD